MPEDSRAVSLNTPRKTKLNKTMYNYMPDRNSIKRKVKIKKKKKLSYIQWLKELITYQL